MPHLSCSLSLSSTPFIDALAQGYDTLQAGGKLRVKGRYATKAKYLKTAFKACIDALGIQFAPTPALYFVRCGNCKAILHQGHLENRPRTGWGTQGNKTKVDNFTCCDCGSNDLIHRSPSVWLKDCAEAFAY